MTAAPPASAPAAPLLLVAVFATIVAITDAIPGNYVSNDMMNNQRLTVSLKGGTLTPTQNRTICQQKCSAHPECDAYSYSGFHKTCQIYKMAKANTPVIQNMYKLYVREKTNEEGYYKYGTDYIRLVLTRMNAYDGAKYCAKDNGLLLSIRNEELNNLAKKILRARSVFTAIFGASDEDEEGTWINSLGADIPGPGSDSTDVFWFFNGSWDRLDRNCAFIKIDGSWAQMNCKNKHYFFCQYPMF